MLKRTFEDLSSRSSSGKSIDKETFLRFFPNVPGMLGERLFYVFNTKRTGEIDFDEFSQGIALYCRGTLEQKIEFVFRMFNLKGDGKVGRSELETMLNSFVFAAESIVSGRENEVSVIGKLPMPGSAGAAAAAGAAGSGRAGTGDASTGYRAFNVLQIDEEDGGSSDNDGNLIIPSSASAARHSFNKTQPLRRQSLPHAHSLYHSSSQPGGGLSTSGFAFPHAPSTPPAGPLQKNLLYPPHSPLPPPSAGRTTAASASSSGTHLLNPSLDFSSDDSARRIQHMVDVAMKIAKKGRGQQGGDRRVAAGRLLLHLRHRAACCCLLLRPARRHHPAQEALRCQAGLLSSPPRRRPRSLRPHFHIVLLLRLRP